MPIPHSRTETWPAGASPEAASDPVRRRRVRALRRIEAARGYLELEMPRHALRELARIGPIFRFQQARLRGEAFFQLEQPDEAIRWYEQALAECPDSLPILMGLAECHRIEDRIEQAARLLAEAHRIHPGEPAVLFALSRCAAARDDVDGAFTWLGRAMRICPEVADWAQSDPDFARLHALPDFRWFVELAKRRVGA